MKRIFPIVAAALLLTACGAPDSEPAPKISTSTTASATSTSSTTSTSAAPTTSAEPTPTVEPAATTGDYYPGDPRLTPINATSDTVGTFLAQDVADPSGKYYVFCNGGTLTKAEGSPVESGTCSELVTWDEVSKIAAQFSDALLVEMEKAFADVEAEINTKMEEEGYTTPNSPYPDASEDAVFNSCWEDGYAQFTDGSVRPYSDCELGPVEQTPSPWVQGQIDWHNCLDAGNTEEYCRATLN
ncbi:hypothetical protein [Corynebacterium ammoniagenes]|jgi:hypothetical protein|uniref:Uncharacterized protein n=1 Tax=Corynebacterium ammoniagenes TaxID=1697 RepID=A0AAV5G705_CORAM|nr:hypothetical protein [Corynebacterium ammoniagenes]APT82665.1 hypothetical protein CAMM_06935 [Corynebacterium ammoniagenes DSM 20306]AQS73728.1 hypothetical protein CA40472_07260 [Corynebacterium ammoniagenes]NMF30725.1 hypothetical protein [Corynebacterium ammoniagenes]GJN42502.1 hypothetical protein CAT723_09810 [Corynebacterium ammoniagenes]